MSLYVGLGPQRARLSMYIKVSLIKSYEMREEENLFKSRMSSHPIRHAVFVALRKETGRQMQTFQPVDILSCLTCLVQNSETAPVECSCDIYI